MRQTAFALIALASFPALAGLSVHFPQWPRVALESVKPAAQDALGSSGGESEKPLAMGVEDFIIDKNDLVDKIVSVNGLVYCIIAEICHLTTTSMTANATFSPKNLPREDRKRLLSCGTSENTCKATVTGLVFEGIEFDIGATSISFAAPQSDAKP